MNIINKNKTKKFNIINFNKSYKINSTNIKEVANKAKEIVKKKNSFKIRNYFIKTGLMES